MFARLDVSDEQRWAAAVRTTEDTFGPVLILVNNAARAIVGTTESHSAEEFREVIDTNLVAELNGSSAQSNVTRRRGTGSGLSIAYPRPAATVRYVIAR